MIVVDTNLICYLYLTGEKTALVEQIFQADPDWRVPLLWRSEFRNVLALYMRKDLLTLDDARRIMAEAEHQLHGKEYQVVSNRILELAHQGSCSAYDAEFIALAQDLSVPLVTTDQKLRQSFPATALSPEKFLAL
jgi:predicted nucleic acid-binding protein